MYIEIITRLKLCSPLGKAILEEKTVLVDVGEFQPQGQSYKANMFVNYTKLDVTCKVNSQ